MNVDDLPVMLSFHKVTPAIRKELKSNKSYIMSVLPELLDGFYQHVGSFPETKGFFRDHAHIEHAKAKQLAHWDVITNAEFDKQYAASVTKIGEVHSRIGLNTSWYIGGYNLLLRGLIERIATDSKSGLFGRANLGKVTALQQAVTCALMVDMDLAISVFMEAGRRARADMRKQLSNSLETNVGSIVNALSASASHVESSALSLTATAEETTQQSTTAKSSCEVSAASVRTASDATVELHASIGEIDRQLGESKAITDQAMKVAQETVQNVAKLSEAGEKIGAIVDLIDNIAAQTNLLALNATIEAARAGEAGKGFAVVAQEVKVLAEQTAKATAEIGSQVSDIQSATESTSGSIAGISDVIGQMSVISQSISDSVHMQSEAMQQITDNTQQATASADEVANNIGGVSEAAAITGQAAAQLLTTATELTSQSDELADKIKAFLEELNAA